MASLPTVGVRKAVCPPPHCVIFTEQNAAGSRTLLQLTCSPGTWQQVRATLWDIAQCMDCALDADGPACPQAGPGGGWRDVVALTRRNGAIWSLGSVRGLEPGTGPF